MNLGIRGSSGEERGSSHVSPMLMWFELITITILCLSCETSFDVQNLKVLNFGISCAFRACIILLCKRGTMTLEP